MKENQNEIDSIISAIAVPATASELVTDSVAEQIPNKSESVAESGNELPTGQASATEPRKIETPHNEPPPASTPAVAEPVTAAELIAPIDSATPAPAPEKKRGRGRPPLKRDENGNPIREEKPPESVVRESGSNPEPLPQPTEPAPAVDNTNYEELAALVFATGTGTLAMVLGPEWNPNNDAEKMQVCLALANYMRAKQVQDIPPGVLLCFVLAAYSAPRLRAPTTASKLKLGWYWIKSKLPKRKKKTPAIAIVDEPKNPFAEKQ